MTEEIATSACDQHNFYPVWWPSVIGVQQCDDCFCLLRDTNCTLFWILSMITKSYNYSCFTVCQSVLFVIILLCL